MFEKISLIFIFSTRLDHVRFMSVLIVLLNSNFCLQIKITIYSTTRYNHYLTFEELSYSNVNLFHDLLGLQRSLFFTVVFWRLAFFQSQISKYHFIAQLLSHLNRGCSISKNSKIVGNANFDHPIFWYNQCFYCYSKPVPPVVAATCRKYY